MEALKPFEEILEADIRQQSFVKLTEQGKFENNTLRDFYNCAKARELHDGVPERIRNHFQTARHLLIYAWFYYPFHVTAMFHALVTAEFALKLRAGSQRGGFERLLKQAIQNGWIRDEGFAHGRHIKERLKRQREEGKVFGHEYPEVESYCTTLLRVLPFLRNELAHGTSMLHNESPKWLRICADLINQLFPKP